MVVDGKAIAEEIFTELAETIRRFELQPHMTAFTSQPDFATQSYLALKQEKAAAVGIMMEVAEFPVQATTQECVALIDRAALQTDGIVVQLPLPSLFDTDVIIQSIPVPLDVDVLHYDGTQETVLPPVVGAIAEICQRFDILLATQQVVVVGSGRLVGQPAAIWMKKQGAHVTVVSKDTPNAKELIAAADVLVLGAGVPGLVQALDIKKGAIIFDAGTSEVGGRIKGDADGLCADKASLMTPVPGGIGPITVAILLKNLVTLTAGK